MKDIKRMILGTNLILIGLALLYHYYLMTEYKRV